MKILITTDAYHTMINGVAVSVHNLYSALKEIGHDVRILTLSQNHVSYQDGDVYYIRSMPLKIYPDARATLPFGAAFVKDILAWAPDIVHSQSEFFTFVFARKISRSLNIPLVHTYHTLYEYYTHYFCPSEMLGKKFVAAATNFILKNTDAIVAPTEKTMRILQNYGVDPPIHILPTGLNLSQFKQPTDKKLCRQMKEKFHIPQDAPVIVTLGRLAREKNVEFLIQRMCDVQLQKIGLHLLIVGDGPDRKRLENLVTELDLQTTVHFAGMVSPEDVATYYRLGDVFVSASGSETQGLTYIEAMASGLPLLCFKDSCLNAVLKPEENGYFYKNADEFTMHLLTMLHSPSQLEKFSCCALHTASSFSKETFAKRALLFYQNTTIQRKDEQECTQFACIRKRIWPRGTGY